MYDMDSINKVLEEFIKKPKTEDEMIIEAFVIAGKRVLTLPPEYLPVFNEIIKLGINERKKEGSFIESTPMYKKLNNDDTWD